MKHEIEELETLIDRLCRHNEDLLRQNRECSKRLSSIEENANRRVDECLRGVQKSELTLRSLKKQLDAVAAMVSELGSAVDKEIANLENSRNQAVAIERARAQAQASQPKQPEPQKPAPAPAPEKGFAGGVIGPAPTIQAGIQTTNAPSSGKDESGSKGGDDASRHKK